MSEHLYEQDEPGTGPLERRSEQNARRRREKSMVKARRDALGQVLGTPAGRVFVWGLLERLGLWRSSFSSDALAMAFQEGRRNEGLVLLAQIQEYFPDGYELMAREARTPGKGSE